MGEKGSDRRVGDEVREKDMKERERHNNTERQTAIKRERERDIKRE